MTTAIEPQSPLRLLVVNTDLPVFPGGGGVEFLTMTRLTRAADSVGLVSMAHTRADKNRAQGLIDAGVHLYLWLSPWLDGVPARPATASRVIHRWLRWLVETAEAGNRPRDTRLMNAAFSNMAPSLMRAMSEQRWNVLAIVQSSAAGMLEHIPQAPVSVLVMHDIRARLYERRAAIAGTWREAWVLEREARRYRRFERDFCRRFDLVTTVSDEDAAWVRQHYRPRRVIVVPLPVDTEHFAPQPAAAECSGRIVFTGLMSHPPNIDAARYFAADVFPVIRDRHPDAEFHIVGRSPDQTVTALERIPGVRVFADVPDMRTHIAQAAVVVVPLRYGSGSRQKILEAWSMEKCIVSTSVGAEGLEYETGKNLIIADASNDLAREVSELLSEPAKRERLRTHGRITARHFHDPERVASGYFAELQRVVAEKASLDAPMRVLLDMRWMVPGLAGGIENLARSFLEQLVALDRTNLYTVLVPSATQYELMRPGIADNVTFINLDSTAALARQAARRMRRKMMSAMRLHDWRTPEVETLRWLRELQVEIGYSFAGYIHPQLNTLSNVLIIPDIQHEYHPEFFSPDALAERRRIYAESARQADHICAISEFTRQTLIERLGIPPEKVTTVRLAADAIFGATPAQEQTTRVLDDLGLQAGRYFYFPAHTWKHKNHRAAIEALRILRDRYGVSLPLICSGGAREAQTALESQIDALGLTAAVRFVGYMPRQSVSALYRGATCLLFPSLFEGFGMPVLEAMASGCPVVCSNTTSLPEIAGDAALLVDPRDAEALAAAVQRVVTDSDLRHDLALRGLERAKIFSWQRHTLETIRVLRKVHVKRLMH